MKASFHSDDTAKHVLAGGADMGTLMRAIDWAGTAVGPVEHWPAPLRTVIRLMLDSRHPMFVWWGPELIQFYNDAYRPILGTTKHPAAMGQRGRECWAEIWPVIEPLIDSVMLRAEATYLDDSLLVLDRNGYLEECYFLYAYCPIEDEAGQVAGIFVACSETTSKVIGARRLRSLRDLAAGAVECDTAERVCQMAIQVLEDNRADLPFALLYLRDAGGEGATLAGCAGLAAGSELTPFSVDLSLQRPPATAPVPAAAWIEGVLAKAAQNGGVQHLNAEQLPAGLPGGLWPEGARDALVVPVTRPGTGTEGVYGWLVAGLSPRLPLDDGYSSFVGLVAGQIASAIGDARALEAERQRAERLTALDQAKTAFFSNVSHELRTPLTLILGPLEQLLERPEVAQHSEVRRVLVLAHRNTLRLLKLVNTLLDFTRIEAGKLGAQYQATDLAGLTADLASTFRSLLESAGLRLVIDTPALSTPAYVAPDLWEKVVLNLLSNAFKFTFEGEVRVSVSETPGHFELRVQDTGTGIPADELPRIFERFHRAKGARGRSFEGSGIGLALVRELVTLHGGTIEAASVPGEGSGFTVSVPKGYGHLPLEQLQSAEPSANRPPGTTTLSEAASWARPGNDGQEEGARGSADVTWTGPGRPRILLADDNADLRAYVTRLLEDQFEVEAVGDGQQALLRAQAQVPDLVLSDVMMPTLDGFGLLRALREDERTRAVPVILLSARAGEEASLGGLEAGANDYLVKPFSASELRRRVGTHIELSRLRLTAAQSERERSQELERRVAERTQQVEEERASLDAFVRFTVAAGQATDVHALAQQASEVLSTLLDVNIGYSELEDGLWKGRVFSEGVPLPTLNAARQGFPADLPSFRQPFLERAAVFIDGWDAESEGAEGTDSYRAAALYPYVLDGSPYGLLSMGSLSSRTWTERDRAVFQAVGRSLGLALERSQTAQALHAGNLALEASNAELRAANEELEAFAYSASHDLRTPVRHVQSFAQLARRAVNTPSPELAVKHLDFVEQAATRMSTLIDAMLHLSHSTRQALTPVPVELGSLVQQARQDLERELEYRAVEWRTAHLPEVLGDPALLQQVMNNLLANAVKFTRTRAQAVIEVWAEEDAAGWTVFVRDNGVGFGEDYRERLFGVFQRLHTDREFEGTGAGLAIVRRIVLRHGGRVDAHSVAGQGATFSFSLPKKD